MKEPIILLGCGGHSKSAIEAIESMGKWKILGLVGNKLEKGKTILGYEVIGSDEILLKIRKDCPNAFIAIGGIGDFSIRTRLMEMVSRIGFKLPSIIAKSALIYSNVEIQEGTFIGHNVIINEGTKIGKGSIINTKSYIDNNVNIGKYSHISTGVQIGSRVEVGEKSFIGSGSIIKEKELIPKESIISAGKLIINYKEAQHQ